MNRFVCSSFFIAVLLLINPVEILASSVLYSSSQTNLGVGEEFLVDAQLSVSTSNGTIYYLRGEFYQNEGSYCGFTWNGSGWYNGPYSGEGWKNLLPISVQDSTWSGQIRAKVDSSDSSCSSSGNYNFRIQRYTSSGSSSSDAQTPIIVSVLIPTPSPIPSASPDPTPQPTSSPAPTRSPSPSPTPTRSSSPKPSPTKSPSPKAQPSGLVLGSEDTKTPSSSPAVKEVSEDSSPVLAFTLVGAGMVLMGFSGYLAFKKQKETLPQNTI